MVQENPDFLQIQGIGSLPGYLLVPGNVNHIGRMRKNTCYCIVFREMRRNKPLAYIFFRGDRDQHRTASGMRDSAPHNIRIIDFQGTNSGRLSTTAR